MSAENADRNAINSKNIGISPASSARLYESWVNHNCDVKAMVKNKIRKWPSSSLLVFE